MLLAGLTAVQSRIEVPSNNSETVSKNDEEKL
jgi:hypothetical protein